MNEKTGQQRAVQVRFWNSARRAHLLAAPSSLGHLEWHQTEDADLIIADNEDELDELIQEADETFQFAVSAEPT